MTNEKIIPLHHEAEMVVIARMVESNNHVRELKPWTKGVYLAANIVTLLTIAYFSMCYLTPLETNLYIQGIMLATSLALWLKYAMLSHQLRYHIRQYERSVHAKETLRKHAQYRLKKRA